MRLKEFHKTVLFALVQMKFVNLSMDIGQTDVTTECNFPTKIWKENQKINSHLLIHQTIGMTSTIGWRQIFRLSAACTLCRYLDRVVAIPNFCLVIWVFPETLSQRNYRGMHAWWWWNAEGWDYIRTCFLISFFLFGFFFTSSAKRERKRRKIEVTFHINFEWLLLFYRGIRILYCSEYHDHSVELSVNKRWVNRNSILALLRAVTWIEAQVLKIPER